MVSVCRYLITMFCGMPACFLDTEFNDPRVRYIRSETAWKEFNFCPYTRLLVEAALPGMHLV